MRKKTILSLISSIILLVTPVCIFGQNEQNDTTEIISETTNKTLKGKATYYGEHYSSKRKTASGEYYSKTKYTAAHRSLPFGTMVKVTNLKNNKSVIVKINDRGPYGKGKIIDLSIAAAKELCMLKSGVVSVIIEVL